MRLYHQNTIAVSVVVVVVTVIAVLHVYNVVLGLEIQYMDSTIELVATCFEPNCDPEKRIRFQSVLQFVCGCVCG